MPAICDLKVRTEMSASSPRRPGAMAALHAAQPVAWHQTGSAQSKTRPWPCCSVQGHLRCSPACSGEPTCTRVLFSIQIPSQHIQGTVLRLMSLAHHSARLSGLRRAMLHRVAVPKCTPRCEQGDGATKEGWAFCNLAGFSTFEPLRQTLQAAKAPRRFSEC